MRGRNLVVALLLYAAAVPLSAQERFSLVVTTAPLPAAATGFLTLRECYALALKESAPLAAQQQVINGISGQYLGALGSVLPNVSYSYTYVHSGLSPNSPVPSYLVSDKSTISQFSLTQQIFSGFREFSALSIARYLTAQQKMLATRLEQTLLSEVTEAFFSLIEQRETVKVLQDVSAVLDRRIKDLQERERVGRSRHAETVSTQVILFQNEARIQSLLSQQLDAEKHLQYLIGRPVAGGLQDTGSEPLPLEEESAYIVRSLNRADLVAARYAVEAAGQQVRISKAEYFPTINLTGNYYAQRTGRLTGVDWDASLIGKVPLLPQVQTAGAVRTAVARLREAKIQLELTKTTVALDVRTAFDGAKALAGQVAAFKRALDAAEENYRLQLQDYRLNLVSNLDVLQAIQSLQSSRQDYLRAVYAAKRAYWRLRVASGESL